MTKHGMSNSPEFAIWRTMRQRCSNLKNKDYADYGGRGITVCDRWAKSFLSFYKDMGPRPAGKWLERSNNDLGYGPGNCIWATPKQQNNNRRPRTLGCDNTTGIIGVSWHSSCRTYRVQLRKIDIGSRRDFFEACCLRKSAENHHQQGA